MSNMMSDADCGKAEHAAGMTDILAHQTVRLTPKLRVRLPVWCAATLTEYRPLDQRTLDEPHQHPNHFVL